MDYGLSYVGFPSVLERYSDASWITNSEDHISTTGWVFLLGGGVISRAFKKQTCISNSTMETEFLALAAAGKEAERLRNLIYDIPLWPKPISPANTWIPRPLVDPLQLKIDSMGSQPNFELNLWDFGGKKDDCFIGLTLAVNPSGSNIGKKFYPVC
ncbi:hypothetical protein Tco_0992843 [Tanacetum coccineum]|uniref:Uncharacterized protein n=1 Tax=Tanacetum coccineum TaxID=301880 RepID=A0ABQ5F463_9ASTR